MGPAPGSGRRTPADAASKLDRKEIRGQAQSAGPPFRPRKLKASGLIVTDLFPN